MTNLPKNNERGFTIIEVMIVAAIMVILTALAVPSYRNFIVRSVRTQAKSTLMLIADRQEQFFLDNKAYTGDIKNLGFKGNPMYVDRDGAEVAAASTDRVYKIQLTNTSATTYTAQAVPELHQAAGDTACGTMSLTHAGQRSQSGSGADCW